MFQKITRSLVLLCLSVTPFFCAGASTLLPTVAPQAAPAVSARLSTLAATAANVRTFGAKGDGKTDDTDALEQALAANAAVYLPAGQYRITRHLTIPATAEIGFAPDAQLVIDTNVRVRVLGAIVADNTVLFGGEGNIIGSPANPVGNPIWFGAKGDGKTDDTAAFEKALDLYRQVDIPYSEQGYVLQDLELSQAGTLLQGESPDKKAKLIAAPDSATVITVTHSQVDVQNLCFEMAAAPQGICLFYNTDLRGMDQCNARYIDAYDAYCVITDGAHASNMMVASKFEHITARRCRGTAIATIDMWGFIFFSDITLDYTESSVTPDFPAFSVRDNAGAVLSDVRIIGNGGTDRAHGIRIFPSAAVWLRDITVSNVGGNGIYMNGCGDLYLLGITVKNTVQTAVSIQTSQCIRLINADVSFDETADEDAHGIDVAGGQYNQLQNITVKNAPKNGINCTASRSNGVNLSLNGCGRYGIYNRGTTSAFSAIRGTGNQKSLTYGVNEKEEA